MSALLDVRDLSVAFGHDRKMTTVVKNISFEVGKGETVALVGESGSGKTLSALAVMGLLPAQARLLSGQIVFGGENLARADERALKRLRGSRLSMIFQEPLSSLNPLMTVGHQIGEIIALHRGTPASGREIIELLEHVGLRDSARQLSSYPYQLSGGQRQRVMIAMMIANKPDLLIADEPTTALDVTVQAQLLDLLKRLRDETGMSLLLITHDLTVVRKMADRICVMSEGEIVERGGADEILTAPRHAYTKRLIAAEPKGRAEPTATATSTLLYVERLSVRFPVKRGLLRRTVDHVSAVKDVSLSVRQGETLAVVGESGSGKTTLGLAVLRLISSTGTIEFEGRPLHALSWKDVRPLRKDMQIVFQDPFSSLSPRMSVGSIVLEGLDAHGLAPADTKSRRAVVAAALEEVGLPVDVQDRFPHEFSGGQRQRIAIARAMTLKPRFVVFDEPTSALDMSVQARVLNLLRDLQRAHDIAYLFISHDLRVVRAMANYVMVMKAGQIVEQGPAEQIYSRPRHDYTKALLAAAFDGERPAAA